MKHELREHPLPPHLREEHEPTHRELLEKLEKIERILIRLEKRN